MWINRLLKSFLKIQEPFVEHECPLGIECLSPKSQFGYDLTPNLASGWIYYKELLQLRVSLPLLAVLCAG